MEIIKEFLGKNWVSEAQYNAICNLQGALGWGCGSLIIASEIEDKKTRDIEVERIKLKLDKSWKKYEEQSLYSDLKQSDACLTEVKK